MQKQDYIYTHKDKYKLHIVSLSPKVPKRVLLIPPLVGATGILQIRTFRTFLRQGCLLMSFDYCGHYDGINKKFTLINTFKDTKAALLHAIECSERNGLALHMVSTCYGLIPLLYTLNDLGWPQQAKSMFSVSGLLKIDDLLDFDGYKPHLAKRNLLFESKSDFVDFMLLHKTDFINAKQKYLDALTDYLLEVFPELNDVISSERFGALEYSRTEIYKSFYEFMTVDLPEITIPEDFPCLFFFGTYDTVLNFQARDKKVVYLKKIEEIAPHAKILNMRIDHFGRGEDHYTVCEEGIRFLMGND